MICRALNGLLSALILTLVLAGPANAGTSQRVPQGFFGVAIDGPLWPGASPEVLASQLNLMTTSGVEAVRAQIDWALVQPYRSWSDVPAGDRAAFTDVSGVPLNLVGLDALVAACAQRGLKLQPLVADAPSWDALPQGRAVMATPADNAPYGRFLGALIARYGPHGSFWQPGVPRVPIRAWQVWNEPNLAIYWVHQPNFAASYVALLKVAHRAIKAADPGARVVMAGLPNVAWIDVAKILRVRGAAVQFDVAAVHPYTRYPQGVLTILERFRRALDLGGARNRPIVVDEFGWNSSLGHHSSHHFGAETTERGQAADLARAIPLLAGARTRLRLLGLDYYNWAAIEGDGADEFSFAGLLRDVNGVFEPKLALAAYRREVLKLERCVRKSANARRCAQTSRA